MNYILIKFQLYRAHLIQLFGIIGAMAGATIFYYENSFISYPDQPDFSSGKTIAYIVKYDLIRYVAPDEAFVAHVAHYTLLVSAALFLLLGVFELKKRGIWFRSN